MELVQIIRALGDENRLRIVNLLRHGHFSVGEIERVLGLSQSNVSRHLGKLRNARIIAHEKRAQWVYYHLNHKMLSRFPLLVAIVEKELDCLEQCVQDLERMRELQHNHPGLFPSYSAEGHS